MKKATDACVLASNNASPAQRGPRRDAQPLHATPLAAVLFPAPLVAKKNAPAIAAAKEPSVMFALSSAPAVVGAARAAWCGDKLIHSAEAHRALDPSLPHLGAHRLRQLVEMCDQRFHESRPPGVLVVQLLLMCHVERNVDVDSRHVGVKD